MDLVYNFTTIRDFEINYNKYGMAQSRLTLFDAR
jgi:hypothetical protein